jgi:hypothetical protein
VGARNPAAGTRHEVLFSIARHRQFLTVCDIKLDISVLLISSNKHTACKLSVAMHRGRNAGFSVTPAGAPGVIVAFSGRTRFAIG